MNIDLIKIWSDSLICKDNKTIKDDILQKLVEDIIKKDTPSLLISSWAIALGRAKLWDNYSDALKFSVWWQELLQAYKEKIKDRKMIVSYLLRDHFETSEKQMLIENLLESIKWDFFTMLNHDDTISRA